MTYGEKIIMFDKKHFQNPELCDDSIIVGSFYSPRTYDIYTVCLRKIKMWNIFNGKVRTIYDAPMDNEITAFDYDEPMKRIYIGDSMGKIKAFNLKNGNYLKEFPAHKAEIINSYDFTFEFYKDSQIMTNFSEYHIYKYFNNIQNRIFGKQC